MRITLNSDYELLIDPDKLHLSVDPVALVESLSEPDLEALTRAVAASRPVLALEHALSVLREADTAEVLHASLDAAEALRRDLAEYADPAAKVWDGTAARPLTPEERKRVMAVAVTIPALDHETVLKSCRRIGLGGGGSIANMARTILETSLEDARNAL